MKQKIFRTAGRYFLVVFGLFFLTTIMQVLWLKWFPPLTTYLMLVRVNEERPKEKANKDFQINARWKNFENISDQIKVAVIASEDQQFAFHSGFDLDAITKAAKHNWKSKRIKGGSTISQQVAKNVFLWPDRSYIRKFMEAYYTILIEAIWGKERILEMYLNVAEMGDGIFGVEAAARKYFRTSAKNLTAEQASLLAAILPNPRKFSAVKPSSYIQAKSRRIRQFMRHIGGVKYLKKI